MPIRVSLSEGVSWAPAVPENLGSWKYGNLEYRNLESVKLNIQITRGKKNVAPSVDKVWISRKILLAPFGAISNQFIHRPRKYPKMKCVRHFPWWSNAPYSLGVCPETMQSCGYGIMQCSAVVIADAVQCTAMQTPECNQVVPV